MNFRCSTNTRAPSGFSTPLLVVAKELITSLIFQSSLNESLGAAAAWKLQWITRRSLWLKLAVLLPPMMNRTRDCICILFLLWFNRVWQIFYSREWCLKSLGWVFINGLPLILINVGEITLKLKTNDYISVKYLYWISVSSLILINEMQECWKFYQSLGEGSDYLYPQFLNI